METSGPEHPEAMQPPEKSNVILRPRAEGQSALSSRSSSGLPAVLTQDGIEPQIFEKNSRPKLSFDTALQTPSPSVNDIQTLIPISVLYIFSGVERRADVGQYLREHPLIAGTISEVDVLRDPEAGDVTVKAVWDKLMSDLSCGVYDVLIITPPCNSFSRATWAGGDPKPCRSKSYPKGFPWASGSNRERARLGNLFVELTLQAIEVAHSSGTLFLLEHPEDLGVTYSGGEPSSIWQWMEVLSVLERTQATTAAFFQCAFNFRTSKPTRIAGTIPAINQLQWAGWPKFNTVGSYRGPLPPSCGHKHEGLIGRQGGKFRTEGSASYPPLMCSWIVDMIVEARFIIATRREKILKVEPERKIFPLPLSSSSASASSSM